MHPKKKSYLVGKALFFRRRVWITFLHSSSSSSSFLNCCVSCFVFTPLVLCPLSLLTACFCSGCSPGYVSFVVHVVASSWFSLLWLCVLGVLWFSVWAMLVHSWDMSLCTSASALSTRCRWSCYCLRGFCQRQMCSRHMQILSSSCTSRCSTESCQSSICSRCCPSLFHGSCTSIFAIELPTDSPDAIES